MQLLKIENETEESYKMAKGSKEARMPLRPGYGKQGREVLLWANYFRMEADAKLLLYRYNIDILKSSADDKVPVGKKAKRIIQLLITEQFGAYQNQIATDYRSNIVSKSELPVDSTGHSVVYSVVYRAEGEDVPSPRAKTYRLRLKNIGTMRVSELVDYLTSTQASAMFGSKDEVIQALNIVLGQYPKTSDTIFSVGANKHWQMSPAASEISSLGAGLQAIRGFFVSVRAATSCLLVNVNVKHVACYDSGPLKQVINAFLRENGNNYNKLESFLKKVRIHVTHIKRKNKDGVVIPRVKTISGLAKLRDGSLLDHPPRVAEFAAGPRDVKFHEGKPEAQPEAGTSASAAGKKSSNKKAAKANPKTDEYISVHDFFHRTYNIKTDPLFPVVNVGTHQVPTYLPAEVCEVVRGQPCGTKLSPKQTQGMIKFAVRNPIKNALSIETNGSKILGIQPQNQVLSEFGIEVTPKLITVPGRVLRAPDVKYLTNKTASTRFGSWNMVQIKFSLSASLNYWSYLWIMDGRGDAWNENQEKFDSSMNAFRSKMTEVGLTCSAFTKGQRISVTADNAKQKITDALRIFAKSPNRAKPKLVVVVLPAVDTVMYNCVKSICDIKAGMHSVCAVGSKFAKPNNGQYFANVALKVNLKLGGRNQVLDSSKLGIISEGKTMVLGIDVTHPSPGSSSSAPSVAGVVASTDKWLSQWPADLRIQPMTQNKEMVAALDEMVKSRLRLWQMRNKLLPENLLVYRDGVSEGEYDKVIYEELPLIRKACGEVYPACDTNKGLPRITIIIVGKRHNTRFYPTKTEDADRSSNPQHGTVVDRDVTETRNWDFFLQAHTALQGTARPAHYYIIWDEIFQNRPVQPPFKNAADVLEDLTHNMCYLFGRATKAVSICPAAYYADLVCERARCYLSRLYDASSAGSVSDAGAGNRNAEDSEVTIHPDLKDTMFYI